jgi:predicted small metal-binding protein
MKLNEILDAVRNHMRTIHEKSIYYERAINKNEYIDNIINKMSVFELLDMLTYLGE